MPNIVIRAEKVTKIYGEKIIAVNEADLLLERQHFYAVMGHSGSGKTTLLQVLGLLNDMTSGQIFIDNKNVSNFKDNQKANVRMNFIGFVFQSFFLDPRLKAYENVMLPMYINKIYRKAEMKSRAVELLSNLGLEERINHYPGELSGGEQQRVAIARSLANDPVCIFADEPTGNLDTENELLVFDFLKKLSNHGKCVLVVSHNKIVNNYADELFLMENGVLSKESCI